MHFLIKFYKQSLNARCPKGDHHLPFPPPGHAVEKVGAPEGCWDCPLSAEGVNPLHGLCYLPPSPLSLCPTVEEDEEEGRWGGGGGRDGDGDGYPRLQVLVGPSRLQLPSSTADRYGAGLL